MARPGIRRPSATRLDIHEVNIQKEIKPHWKEISAYVVSVLRTTGISDVEAEELAILPGMEERTALMYVNQFRREQRYDVIVLAARENPGCRRAHKPGRRSDSAQRDRTEPRSCDWIRGLGSWVPARLYRDGLGCSGERRLRPPRVLDDLIVKGKLIQRIANLPPGRFKSLAVIPAS